jgi:drebrin-like protein
VPSNYLEEIDDGGPSDTAAPAPAAPEPASAGGESNGATATALYDYEAGEDNELSFPENAIVTNIVSINEVLTSARC